MARVEDIRKTFVDQAGHCKELGQGHLADIE